MEYKEYANLFLILSDENRLKIIKQLSNRELCACELLKQQNITQPTLSHHMKKLVKSNLVIQRREKKHIYYKLNRNVIDMINEFVDSIKVVQHTSKEIIKK